MPGPFPAVRLRAVADGDGWEFVELDDGRWQVTIEPTPGAFVRYVCSAAVLWRNAAGLAPEIRAAMAADPVFVLAAGIP